MDGQRRRRASLSGALGLVTMVGAGLGACSAVQRAPALAVWPNPNWLLAWLTAPAVGLGIVLVRELSGGWRRARWVAVGWRLLALVGLVAFLAEVVEVLPRAYPAWKLPEAQLPHRPRPDLTRLTGALGLLGLALGLLPVHRRGEEDAGHRGGAASVALAAFVGLVCAASAMCLAYMACIAIEGVRMRLPLAGAAPVVCINSRLEAALPATLGTSVAGLVTAILISRRLRQGLAPGRLLGILLAIVIYAAGASWLVLVEMPSYQPCLAEGMAALVRPDDVARAVLGPAILAAGIVARALGPRPSDGMRTTAGRLISGLAIVVLVAIDLLLTAGVITRSRRLRQTTAGRLLAGWPPWLRDVLSLLPRPFRNYAAYLWFDLLVSSPEYWLLAVGNVWLSARVGAALLGIDGSGPAPFDAVLASRSTARRFAGHWLALSVLMLASIPTFAAAGLLAYHLVLVRWAVFG